MYDRLKVAEDELVTDESRPSAPPITNVIDEKFSIQLDIFSENSLEE